MDSPGRIIPSLTKLQETIAPAWRACPDCAMIGALNLLQ
jgi:hypothetical protein